MDISPRRDGALGIKLAGAAEHSEDRRQISQVDCSARKTSARLVPEWVMMACQCWRSWLLTVLSNARKNKGEFMTRVLLLGYDPETVDFSDPALPPGMTAEKVHAGIAVALKQFAARGWEGEVGFIRPDETAGPTVERQLASKSYDCVVIGAGVRLPPRGLALFEAVINAVHKAAPGAAIAFNTRPDDSADAAARWLTAGSPAA